MTIHFATKPFRADHRSVCRGFHILAGEPVRCLQCKPWSEQEKREERSRTRTIRCNRLKP